MLLNLFQVKEQKNLSNNEITEKPFLHFDHLTCRIPNDTVDNQLVKTVFPFLANNSRVQGNAIAALNLAPIFIHIEESAGIPISVCLAHWAMETGWGSSNRFINNRNFGGIIWKNKTPHWDNVDDAISYWIRVLTQPNYTKYFKASSHSGDSRVVPVSITTTWNNPDKQESTLITYITVSQ